VHTRPPRRDNKQGPLRRLGWRRSCPHPHGASRTSDRDLSGLGSIPASSSPHVDHTWNPKAPEASEPNHPIGLRDGATAHHTLSRDRRAPTRHGTNRHFEVSPLFSMTMLCNGSALEPRPVSNIERIVAAARLRRSAVYQFRCHAELRHVNIGAKRLALLGRERRRLHHGLSGALSHSSDLALGMLQKLSASCPLSSLPSSSDASLESHLPACQQSELAVPG
jgi:hypothetical protein